MFDVLSVALFLGLLTIFSLRILSSKLLDDNKTHFWRIFVIILCLNFVTICTFSLLVDECNVHTLIK